MRLLDHLGLVTSTWAIGNNRHLAGNQTISGYCMSSNPNAASCGALDRHLSPQFYSSLGGQCSAFAPTCVTTTFGVLPWGGGYRDFGETGGGTSSCSPQLAGVLALMMSQYPGRPFSEYRAAIRASANNTVLGLPGIAYFPLTGAGLIQADNAIRAVPSIRSHPWNAAERIIPTSIPFLGQEPEMR